jgi:hypothetical protein
VYRADIARHHGWDSGLHQLAAICLAFVPEDIVFGGDDQSTRQTCELTPGREEWRGVRFLALLLIRQVLIPEPLHGCSGQPRTVRKLLV